MWSSPQLLRGVVHVHASPCMTVETRWECHSHRAWRSQHAPGIGLSISPIPRLESKVCASTHSTHMDAGVLYPSGRFPHLHISYSSHRIFSLTIKGTWPQAGHPILFPHDLREDKSRRQERGMHGHTSWAECETPTYSTASG